MPSRLLHHEGDLSLWRLVRDASFDDRAAIVSVLRDKPTVRTLRVQVPNDATVVLKLWRRTRWPQFVNAAARRFTTAYREWSIPPKLTAIGITVATPLAYFHFRASDNCSTDAVVMTDMGSCRALSDHIKELLARDDVTALKCVETQLVQVTERMVHNGFLDHDHGIGNFVYVESKGPIRLDFEHCRFVPRTCRLLASAELSRMLACLIGTYAFAVQPHEHHATRFAQRLAETVHPARHVLRSARARVEQMMATQNEEIGILTQLNLEW